MNRQIKFRGKNIEGKWVNGYYRCIKWKIDKTTHQIINGNSFFEVDPNTVGQFAEIKDYCEGDIIRWYELDFEYIGEIYFEDGIFCVRDDIEEDRVLYWIDRDFKTEIIGNTTDNPELLKGE